MSNFAERATSEPHLPVIGMEQAEGVIAPTPSGQDCTSPEGLLSRYVEYASDHTGQKIVEGLISVGALIELANAAPSSWDAKVAFQAIRLELHEGKHPHRWDVSKCEQPTQTHIHRLISATNSGGNSFRGWATQYYAKEVDDLGRLMTFGKEEALRRIRALRASFKAGTLGIEVQATNNPLQLKP